MPGSKCTKQVQHYLKKQDFFICIPIRANKWERQVVLLQNIIQIKTLSGIATSTGYNTKYLSTHIDISYDFRVSYWVKKGLKYY